MKTKFIFTFQVDFENKDSLKIFEDEFKKHSIKKNQFIFSISGKKLVLSDFYIEIEDNTFYIKRCKFIGYTLHSIVLLWRDYIELFDIKNSKMMYGNRSKNEIGTIVFNKIHFEDEIEDDINEILTNHLQNNDLSILKEITNYKGKSRFFIDDEEEKYMNNVEKKMEKDIIRNNENELINLAEDTVGNYYPINEIIFLLKEQFEDEYEDFLDNHTKEWFTSQGFEKEHYYLW